jgi:hypothetical protein
MGMNPVRTFLVSLKSTFSQNFDSSDQNYHSIFFFLVETRSSYFVKFIQRSSYRSFSNSIHDNYETNLQHGCNYPVNKTSFLNLSNQFFSRRISSLDQHEKLLDEKSNKNQLILDNLNNKHYLLCREIFNLLEYGLKERISLLCPLPSIDQRTKTVSFFLTFFSIG